MTPKVVRKAGDKPAPVIGTLLEMADLSSRVVNPRQTRNSSLLQRFSNRITAVVPMVQASPMMKSGFVGGVAIHRQACEARSIPLVGFNTVTPTIKSAGL